MNLSELKFGHEYEDEISGFKGIATGIHGFINGCVRVTMEGTVGDSKEPKDFAFDIQNLRPVKNGRTIAVPHNLRLVDDDDAEAPAPAARTGGPRVVARSVGH